jgi:uncharacterized membrane protein
MKTALSLSIFLVVLSFAIAVYFLPQMPERMASHWNAAGEADGTMPKAIALFIMPVISVLLLLLFALIPKIDPLKENIAKFRKYFDRFVLIIIAFFFYIYLLTIAWNIGYRYNLIAFLAPAFAVLFYYCGILVENAKRNWFIGIRTPWTMSSEKVWNKTHALGGKLFKACGIISLLGLFFQKLAIFFVIVPVVLVAAYLVVYSYLEYQRENAATKKKK